MRLFISSSVLAAMAVISSPTLAFEVEHEAHVHGHATLNIVQEKDELLMQFKSPAFNIVGFEHQPSSAADKSKVESAERILKDPSLLFVFNASAGCAVEHAKVSSELLEDGDHHGHGKKHGKHHDEHDDHGHGHGKKHGKHHDDHDDHGHDHGKKHGKHHDDHDDHGHGHGKKHGKHHEDHDDHGHDHGKKHGKHHDEHDDHGHGHGKKHGHGKHEHHGEETHSEFEAEYHFECANIESLKSIEISLIDVFPSLEEVDAQIVTNKGQKLIELSGNSKEIKF